MKRALTFVLIAVLAALSMGADSCGTTDSASKASKPSGPDCGTPSPQEDGSNVYLDVPGAPMVAGDFSCAKLLKLSKAVRHNKGPALFGAIEKLGWRLVPSDYQRVGVETDLVFGRHGGQVAFDPAAL